MKLLLMSLLLSLNAQALTGRFEVTVQKSNHKEFKGVFWNDVDKTIGPGESPKLDKEDLLAAFKEEFEDPERALAQLEKLKGPEGTIFFYYGYDFRDKERLQDAGDLQHACGVTDKTHVTRQKHQDMGSYVSRHGNIRNLPPYADDGKFYQLKWASKEQMRRHMALCFSRLPGMPRLKPRRPSGETELHFPDELYVDFHSWLSTIPGLEGEDKKSPKMKEAARCLMKNAAEKVPDRSGNVVIIQKAKADALHRKTLADSEATHLADFTGVPESKGKSPHVYSIAFMDQSSYGNIKGHLSKGIQTQGIWPNFQGGSVASLMAQVYGDELRVNMKACLLHAGLKVPNPDEALSTIRNPYDCRDVDVASITPYEKLDYECENGKGESCLTLGDGFLNGKKFDCLPKNFSGSCQYTKNKTDERKAQIYYERACDRNVPEGCYALGAMIDQHTEKGNSLSKGHLYQYKRGCKLKSVPECTFWERDLDKVDERTLPFHQKGCEGKFGSRDHCHGLAIYHLQRDEKDKAIAFMKRACDVGGIKRAPGPCVDLAQLYLKDGKKKDAMKVLRKECGFIDKVGCKELYELSSEKEKKELVNRVCWQTKELCF